ncbi:MAG: hypothetical protein QOG67_1779 [Verrucomicrobiota bacterium]
MKRNLTESFSYGERKNWTTRLQDYGQRDGRSSFGADHGPRTTRSCGVSARHSLLVVAECLASERLIYDVAEAYGL